MLGPALPPTLSRMDDRVAKMGHGGGKKHDIEGSGTEGSESRKEEQRRWV